MKNFKDVAFLVFKYADPDAASKLGIPEILHANNNARSFSKSTRDQIKLDDLSCDIEALGPAFTRIAQLLSKRTDLLPLAYVEALQKVGTNLPVISKEEINNILQTEFGKETYKLFSRINYDPFSSSVFTQTHLATKLNGAKVVIKIMRPLIFEKVSLELNELSQMVDFFEQAKTSKLFNYKLIFDEIQKTIHSELDFHQEALNLKHLKENLASFNLIEVPAPILPLCTDRIITTKYVEGINLQLANLSGLLSVERARLANQVFQAFLNQFLVDGFVHSSFKPENVYFTNAGKIALLDMGTATHITKNVQEGILKLILAINEGRGNLVAKLLSQIGITRENFDESSFQKS